jgi:hypothetical protein
MIKLPKIMGFVSTHMPFFRPGAAGGMWFFAGRVNVADSWHLYNAFPGGEPEEMHLGHPDEWNHCCPSSTYDPEEETTSYIAGPNAGPYHLYEITEGYRKRQVCQADVGFTRWGWTVWGSRRGPIHIDHAGHHRTLSIAGLDYLYRVCYDVTKPDTLIITCSVAGQDIVLLHDLAAASTSQLLGNALLYKACRVDGNTWAYAHRLTGDFESRRLALAFDPATLPYAGTVTVAEATPEAAGKDCLPCLRKHLAQAISYAKEIANGHGKGSALDHRPDLEGEIGNAEQHAAALGIDGYRRSLRDLRHNLDARAWQPGDDDIALLRRMWQSAMGLSNCNCKGQK